MDVDRSTGTIFVGVSRSVLSRRYRRVAVRRRRRRRSVADEQNDVFFKNLQFNLQCGGVTFNAAMEYEWTFAASGRARRVFSRRGRESTPERRRRRRGRGRRAVGCDGRDGRLWRGRRDRA